MLDSLLIIRGKGPILITGPHAVKTIRNKSEIHREEEYIYEIVNIRIGKLGSRIISLFNSS